jgi:hypothetical protein
MKTINEQMNEPRELLFAFINGSYKKIKSVGYDHKEWIVVKRENGKQVFINTDKIKYIEEI